MVMYVYFVQNVRVCLQLIGTEKEAELYFIFNSK